MIKFKIDENLPVEIAYILEINGYNAETVSGEKLSGYDDKIISNVCKKEQRILVTMDLDFSDIKTYPPQEYPGFLVLRLKKQDKLSVIKCIEKIIPIFKT